MERTPEQIALMRLEQRITRRFHKACATYGLIADGDHVLVGLSGGKDSLALVELLGRRARVHVPKFRVSAVHVRVRERDYQSDTSYLEQFCREAGVELHIIDTSIESRDTEERAETARRRKLADNPCFLCSWYRRKAMFDLAQQLGCNKIALGHHRDDLEETFLMNLIFQGAVATIPPRLQMERMPLEMIRPLCLVSEADLAEYARMRGYRRQPKLCPLEHVSSRTKVKGLLAQLEQLNPEVRDTLWSAMENIKWDYLPHPIDTKHSER
jgi:tRNA(Ile)-lysidine synthase TilS/MesJ